MLLYFLRKFALFVTSLFVIASLTFFLMKMLPGDPFSSEQAMRSDMQGALQKHYGLNRSWTVQYFDYLLDIFRGDLGVSFQHGGRSVVSIIAEGFPVSAHLGLQAFFLALFGGSLLGILAAVKTGQWEERQIFVWMILFISIPSFVLAALLQYLFGSVFSILPIARWTSFSHTLLPTLALAATPMAFIARLTQAGMQEVLKSDYIKLAKAKGLKKRGWIFRHALPNAFLPVLTYLGPLFANVLVGSFVIEKIFNIPGIGQWFVASTEARDYSLIMGLTLFYSFILLTAVFLVDLLYGLLDPRLRLTPRSV